MKKSAAEDPSADVVDRIWRVYAPFQRGRSTVGDLTSMLALLVLARFVESVRESKGEFVTQWDRAVAEARIGISPLMDLRAAMRSASRHKHFPVPDLRDAELLGGDGEPDEMPWAGAFLAVLEQSPSLTEATLPEVFELLLERHIQEGTFSAGEFYTPSGVARLLIELASPNPGDRILDPACGAGSLLSTAAQRIADTGDIDGTSFEAYATDRSNLRLAMMNLAIHGVDRPVVRTSDPASLFQIRGNRLVDRVVSNPPFNQRLENVSGAGWPFGTPPESNANFAWLQLALSWLSENGTATMIMPPRAAWSTSHEASIRKNMITAGVLLGVIALPPNLFPHTSVPVHIWLLARDKTRRIPADEANAVLFIDASQLGTQLPRRSRVLGMEDVERISGRLHEWLRSPRQAPDEPGFSRSVTEEEILENGGSLDPRLYIDISRDRQKTTPDLSSALDELNRSNETAFNSTVEIQKSLTVCERLTSGGVEPPRLPLGDIVSGTARDGVEDSTAGQLYAGPSGSLIRTGDFVDAKGVPVVMPRDLTASGFNIEHIRYIPESKAKSLERFRLHRGDIVLARRGELGRCAVVRAEQDGWICGTGCFALRPPTALDADYFAVYLRSPEARDWLESHSTGSMTMKTISRDVLNELPVVLPDLGTQRTIADMAKRVDEYEQLLRDQLDLTDKIRRESLNSFFKF